MAARGALRFAERHARQQARCGKTHEAPYKSARTKRMIRTGLHALSAGDAPCQKQFFRKRAGRPDKFDFGRGIKNRGTDHGQCRQSGNDSRYRMPPLEVGTAHFTAAGRGKTDSAACPFIVGAHAAQDALGGGGHGQS